MPEDDNLSELVDEEKLEDLPYPPDRPLGVDDRTLDGEESVVERIRREQRWDRRRDPSGVGPIVDPTSDSGIDDESDAVGLEAREDWDPLGIDRSAQDNEEIEPAEEAAMHLTDDPPFDDDDGYIED